MPRDSEINSKEASQLEEDIPILIGPSLPPHLIKTVLPPEETNEVIGPKLPSESNNSFGPQLPPHLLKPSEDDSKVTLGPSLPPHLRKQLEEQAVEETNSSEDDCYGPLPPGAGPSSAHVALEERALQMRIDKLEPDKNEPVRETWMIELPEAKKASQFGLGPRQFRKNAAPDMSDRSAWTDVAGEKAKRKEKKVDLKEEAELKELEKRDREYDKVSKKLKRKAKSLVEMHQEKVKKTTEESTERRPFSRDTDLQVNKFDEAQKKAILKKAQLLDDRFSSGKAKYL